MPVSYKRVILKLSGEALGVDGKGFCHEKFEDAAKMLIDIKNTGVELAVVIGHIVLFACGIGSPCFSTDTTVVLRGIELECDAILMAKNIDGVYTADPRLDPNATMIRDITYAEASARGLKVMDAAAFTILSDNNVPQVRVFGLEPAENIIKVLEGDMVGTVLHP